VSRAAEAPAVEQPIVDAHHHLWDLERNRYPWLEERPLRPRLEGDVSPIARTYGIEDYLADVRGEGVVRSVHVETGWDPSDPVGETAWLQSVADVHGFPHAIVARAELQSPRVQEVLEGHLQHRNARGIRQILNWHRDPVKSYLPRPDLIRDPAWRAGFRLLGKLGLSFDLQLYPTQLLDGAELARDFPDQPIVLDHAGMAVDRDPEGLRIWSEGMKALAEAPNVMVKISALGTCDWRWTVDSIRPFVLDTIEWFGADRCMFASNFPVDKLYSDLPQLFGAFRQLTRGFSRTERAKLFHDNAARFYRL
jgi:predicted TIM-barrel fold metal-dependent hydrolase